MTERVVAAFPWYPDNPWQAVVYGALGARGARVVGLEPFLDEAALRAQLGGRLPDTLHLGWTTPVAQVVPDVLEAFGRVDAFTRVLDAVREQGVRIVWTVHNVLPHEMPHVTPELLLHRRLAALADVVHVMNPRTADLTAGLYTLPTERTVVVPHPSYRGRLAPVPAPRDPDAGTTLLVFGALRPYKGVLEFADLVARARSVGADVRLVVAGRVGGGWTEASLQDALVPFGDAVETRLGYVEDDAVPALFATADALVLPYRAGLNSGAAMLAATLATPVLLGSGLRDSVALDPTWQLPLWPDAAGGALTAEGAVDEHDADVAVLLDALRRLRGERDALAAGAAAAADRAAPERIAARFATVLLGPGTGLPADGA